MTNGAILFQFGGLMNLKVALLILGIVLTAACSGNQGSSEVADGKSSLRTAELPADALLDQLGSTSTFTTIRDLYVAGGVNFVTDIVEDNNKVTSCILNLPQSARKVAAYWIPIGTTFPIVKAKIGEDRSFALATEEGDPFVVPRLSCWTLAGDLQPLTVQFLSEALAPTFIVDARQ